MKKNLLKAVSKNSFAVHTVTLVSGTAIGQLISIASLPILTRIYSPSSFSSLAVYVSALTLLTAVTGLCLENAIPLPKSNRTAAALFLSSIISIFIFTILITLAVIFIPNTLNFLSNNKISQYLWLLPIGVFTVSIYRALQLWSTRKKKFTLIAKTRVTQSISGTSFKIGTGLLMNGSIFGLIFGQLLMQGAGFIGLGLSLLKNDLKVFKDLKPSNLIEALKEYDKFPKFTTLEVFINTASIQVPIILIAQFAIASEAGHMMIAMQLLSAPISMISGAISQVYLSEISDKYHRGNLEVFTKNIIKKLIKIALVPSLLISIISPFLIPYILGEDWSRTGVLISWMIPWFFMQFITSPVSTALYITNNQKLGLLLQLIGLIIRISFVYFAVSFSREYISEAYAISGFIFYSIYLVLILKIISTKHPKSVNKKESQNEK